MYEHRFFLSIPTVSNNNKSSYINGDDDNANVYEYEYTGSHFIWSC